MSCEEIAKAEKEQMKPLLVYFGWEESVRKGG
jgi:hypothetical protein